MSAKGGSLPAETGIKPWKVLESEYLVNAPWAVLRRDRCEMSSGHLVPEYYVLEYPDWVNAVAVTPENEFILIRQYRHGVQEVLLEIPAGAIDPGEAPLEAVTRELLEETGFAPERVESLVDLFPNPATSNNQTHTFLLYGCRKVSPPKPDPQEEIEVILMPAGEVLRRLYRGEFKQALHAAALFYACIRLGFLPQTPDQG